MIPRANHEVVKTGLASIYKGRNHTIYPRGKEKLGSCNINSKHHTMLPHQIQATILLLRKKKKKKLGKLIKSLWEKTQANLQKFSLTIYHKVIHQALMIIIKLIPYL